MSPLSVEKMKSLLKALVARERERERERT